jgi:triacylglycerol lipase
MLDISGTCVKLYKCLPFFQNIECQIYTDFGHFDTKCIKKKKSSIMIMGESGTGKSTLVYDLTNRDDVHVSSINHGDVDSVVYKLGDFCEIIDTIGFSVENLHNLKVEYNLKEVDLVLYFIKDIDNFESNFDKIKDTMFKEFNKCILVLSHGDSIELNSIKKFQDWFEIQQHVFKGKVLDYVIIKNLVKKMKTQCELCELNGNLDGCDNIICPNNVNPMKVCPICYGATKFSSDDNFWKCKDSSCYHGGVNYNYKDYGKEKLNKLVTDTLPELKKMSWFRNSYNTDIEEKIERSLDIIDDFIYQISWTSSISDLVTELISKIINLWFDSFEVISAALASSLSPTSNISKYFYQQHYVLQYGINCIRYCIYLYFQGCDNSKIKKHFKAEFEKLDFNENIYFTGYTNFGMKGEDITTRETRTQFLMKIVKWHLFDEETKKNIFKASKLTQYIYSYPHTLQWDVERFYNIDTWKSSIHEYQTYLHHLKALETLDKDFLDYLSNSNPMQMLNTNGGMENSNSSIVEELHQIYDFKFDSLKKKIGDTFKIDVEKYTSITEISNLIKELKETQRPPAEYYLNLVESIHSKDEKIENNHSTLSINVEGDIVNLQQRACIIGSFLDQIHTFHKTEGLEQFKNIDFFNVSIGFRHGFHDKNWKPLLTESVVQSFGKSNEYASFEDGELDYIMFTLDNDHYTEVWIVFSGSNSPKDWQNNITLSFSSENVSGLICHSGFEHVWSTYTKKNIDSSLKEIDKKFPATPLKFLVCGHSLGGALATLTGNYLKCLDERRDVQVFSIGGPAMFVENEETDKFLSKENVINIVNLSDPVFNIQSLFGRMKRIHAGALLPLFDKDKPFATSTDMFEYHDISRYCRLIRDLYENNAQ